jgi:hypothetical protein
MFPLVPVDSQTGDIADWGTPFHGLFTLVHQDPWAQFNGAIPGDGLDRSFLMTHNGVRLGYPDWSGLGPHQAPFDPVDHGHRKFPNTQNSRKIVVPGHTYTRDPELAGGDLLNGMDYKPFAIANNSFIGGFDNGGAGWVYVADDGSRWSVVSTALVGEPDWARWTFTFSPFGISRMSNEFYGITNVPNVETSTCTIVREGVTGFTDITQSGGGGPTFLDQNSNGSKALIGMGGGQNSGLYENFNPVSLGAVVNQRKSVAKAAEQVNAVGPSIIWEIAFTGTPEVDLDVTVSVFRTQEQCAGTVVKNVWDDNLIKQYWGGYYQVPCGTTPPAFLRPNTGFTCPPGQFPSGAVQYFNVSLLDAAVNGPIATTCGWTRTLDDGTSIIDQNFNEFNDFKEWTFTDAGAEELYPDWGPISKEYSVNEVVAFNGIPFRCTVAHTSDPLKQPGVGNLWTTSWELPYKDVNFDVQDVSVYAEASSYSRFDLVREGASDYWIAKGGFTSFDSSDEDATNYDQPNVGENFEAFWDGPFNVLLNPVWIADKAILQGWIIESTYTDPAIPTDGTITLARWECIRSHVSVDGPDGNKPGVGSDWPNYWEKAFSTTTLTLWEEPTAYVIGSKVNFFFDGENRQWEAAEDHSATAANAPGLGAEWTENVSDINCREALGQLEGSLNQLSYHIRDHRTRTEDIDFHVTNIAAGAFYTDADTVKLVEVDVHYTRKVVDTAFDHSWVWTDRLSVEDATATGNITRGPSFADESFQYKFRVGGVVKQTIDMVANATAEGVDDWTEDFANYPLTWAPTGSRSLFAQVGDEIVHDFDNSFTVADTAFGGATEGEMFDLDIAKREWAANGFVGSFMFRWIELPFLQTIKDRLQARVLENPDFPGAGIINFLGGTVSLGQLTNEQYSIPHPVRSQEQIDNFDPFPTILTLFYGRKLAGPFQFGLKTNGGVILDSQYLKALAPGDMPWIQYGIYAPDAEDGTIVTLTKSSPIEVNTATWLFKADYGDDIACAYDPITFAIHRNSQYRVVYV